MNLKVCLKVVLPLFASFLASVHHSLAAQETVLESNSSVLMRNKEHGIGFAAFKKHEYRHLNVTPVVVLQVTSRKECAFMTAMNRITFSFNFAVFPDIHGLHRCELLDTDLFNKTDKLRNSSIFHHYSIVVSLLFFYSVFLSIVKVLSVQVLYAPVLTDYRMRTAKLF